MDSTSLFPTHLPPLHETELDVSNDELPPLYPRFFVPRLDDKPQDPIMDTLKILRASQTSHPLPHIQVLPSELLGLTDLHLSPLRDTNRSSQLWLNAARTTLEHQSSIRSWDALRTSFSKTASPSPFLSEQSAATFAAARYHVDPRIHDASTKTIHVPLKDLLASMRMMLIGHASPLYAWDHESETFVVAHIEDGKRSVLVVDGRDDVVTESFMMRFMTIGALLRRIDIFTDSLRRRDKEGPTVHSFAHALSCCIQHLRNALFSPDTIDQLDLPTAFWLRHAEYEEVLTALASLCCRGIEFKPSDYPEFLSLPASILTAIYTHLDRHVERDSPRMLKAMLAYILTATSDDYFQSLGREVGYRRDLSSMTTYMKTTPFEPQPGEMFDDGGEVEDEESASANGDEAEFPSFISPDVAETFVRARKSLKLLRAAQADHPLLQQGTLSRRKISWYWSSEAIESAWNNESDFIPDSDERDMAAQHPDLDAKADGADVLLVQFKIFDLEPGTHFDLLTSSYDQGTALQRFLDKFPHHLPPLTPTLHHLAVLVLSPLLEHCSAVSSSLLFIFLSPNSHLNVHSHLVLLRSYMLLTSTSFTSRLQSALFSDSDAWDFESSSARAMAKQSHVRTRPSSSTDAPWAVGLGLGLSERDSWPPGGADLSYYLRTVIVESLESSGQRVMDDISDHESSNVKEGQALILAEAESRLGFAIRDLPIGSGRERWLNPCSIEALDFLLMDYKPPHPLDVIIAPDVLSKYQRIFSFVLRLMRVKNALASLFRMTRKRTEPLFPTLVASNKLLLRFRFIAQNFVEALTSYVADTAVRGNFDTFLAHVAPEVEGTRQSSFPDVFALSELHSSMLDDVLSACLLRSSQRAATDLLKASLELVLDLCILSGELKRGRLEEYKAAPVLQELYTAFVKKMTILIKVLKAMVDKGSASSHLPLEFAYLAKTSARMAPGGTGSLHHLLVKIDASDWFSKTQEGR
ncbi:hypothetical protein BV25DRAFT_1913006 [Artomyces pyxidatus]|uniref:Uncharacterized protein n=1 Tax=Artomyces pyxidatus TaxID=48021 RepID=A0ACB8TCS9_9AGAM|nr:hypothetical protein BV25DRAFT_1913006 [Artomyces pyxidatus]